jgi:uncharacterized protein (TIGR03086 family)
MSERPQPADRPWDEEVQRLLSYGRDREAAELAARHLGTPPTTQGATMGPLEQLDLLAPRLGAVIAGIGDDQLDAPTPCTEFTVTGVLDHMIGGATAFAAAFRGESAPAAPEGGDRRQVVADALGELVAAMQSPGALDRTIDAPFGATPGETFARFVVLDGLVHGWDLATATGQEYEPPAELVAAVEAFARDAVPPLRNGAVFRDEAAPPPDATPIERLAAFTGRKV